MKLEVTSADLKKVIEAAIIEAGGIDVLVNNAGWVLLGTLESLRYGSPTSTPGPPVELTPSPFEAWLISARTWRCSSTDFSAS